MKINGFEYSKQEVLDALRKKGYVISEYGFTTETHIHGSRFHEEPYSTEIAIKEAKEQITESDIWYNVAMKTFQISLVRPPLI